MSSELYHADFVEYLLEVLVTSFCSINKIPVAQVGSYDMTQTLLILILVRNDVRNENKFDPTLLILLRNDVKQLRHTWNWF